MFYSVPPSLLSISRHERNFIIDKSLSDGEPLITHVTLNLQPSITASAHNKTIGFFLSALSTAMSSFSPLIHFRSVSALATRLLFPARSFISYIHSRARSRNALNGYGELVAIKHDSTRVLVAFSIGRIRTRSRGGWKRIISPCWRI